MISTRMSARGENRSHGSAMKSFRQQAAVMKKDARDLAESAGAVAREQFDPLRTYVNEKPLQSLLIVGGIGLFLGLLFGRR